MAPLDAEGAPSFHVIYSQRHRQREERVEVREKEIYDFIRLALSLFRMIVDLGIDGWNCLTFSPECLRKKRAVTKLQMSDQKSNRVALICFACRSEAGPCFFYCFVIHLLGTSVAFPQNIYPNPPHEESWRGCAAACSLGLISSSQ